MNCCAVACNRLQEDANMPRCILPQVEFIKKTCDGPTATLPIATGGGIHVWLSAAACCTAGWRHRHLRVCGGRGQWQPEQRRQQHSKCRQRARGWRRRWRRRRRSAAATACCAAARHMGVAAAAGAGAGGVSAGRCLQDPRRADYSGGGKEEMGGGGRSGTSVPPPLSYGALPSCHLP